jgi:hypothetical protein
MIVEAAMGMIKNTALILSDRSMFFFFFFFFAALHGRAGPQVFASSFQAFPVTRVGRYGAFPFPSVPLVFLSVSTTPSSDDHFVVELIILLLENGMAGPNTS